MAEAVKSPVERYLESMGAHDASETPFSAHEDEAHLQAVNSPAPVNIDEEMEGWDSVSNGPDIAMQVANPYSRMPAQLDYAQFMKSMHLDIAPEPGLAVTYPVMQSTPRPLNRSGSVNNRSGVMQEDPLRILSGPASPSGVNRATAVDVPATANLPDPELNTDEAINHLLDIAEKRTASYRIARAPSGLKFDASEI